MAVEQVAARVTEVLSRAESLFAEPGDPQPAVAALGRLTDASESATGLQPGTAELSGALAAEHQSRLAATGAELQQAADSDTRLAERLTRSTELHAQGRTRAAGLRGTAAEVPDRLGPYAELPAAGLAALTTLRDQLAGMQRLLLQHGSTAARTAADVRDLAYGGAAEQG